MDRQIVRRGRTALRLAALVALTMAPMVTGAVGTPAAGAMVRVRSAGARALLANPARDVAPSRAQQLACFGPDGSAAACSAAALADIDRARRGEHLGPLLLPARFASMGLRAQVLAVANAERTSRHLPAMAQSATLDGLAQGGVVTESDPYGPAGFGWGSNLAVGEPTALAADFAWMYDDGPGGSNVDCSAGHHGGCWGHRDNILLPGAGRAGAGVGRIGRRAVFTELFVPGYR